MAFLAKVQLSCFLLSYLVALGGEVYQVLRKRTALTRSLLVGFGAAGLIAHTAYLVNRSSESGLPPLVGSSHDWLLVLAWLGALLYLLIVGTGQRLAVGLFLLPVVLGLVLMATFVDQSVAQAARQVASHRWGMLHASALVIGMGTVALATICALMYLLQYQKLTGRGRYLHLFQFPSLEKLTSLNHWLVAATVAMLTVGLVTGFILAAMKHNSDAGAFEWSDPIVWGTTVVWAVMVLALVWLLKRKDQSGRQVARLTFLAGGFLLLTIFGLMLLSGGVHGRPSIPSAALLFEFMEGGSQGG